VAGSVPYASPFTQLCESYKCPKCGQVITDGLPCGCGARPEYYSFQLTGAEVKAVRLAVLQQTVALGAERLRAAADPLCSTYTSEIATLDGVTKKLHSI